MYLAVNSFKLQKRNVEKKNKKGEKIFKVLEITPHIVFP